MEYVNPNRPSFRVAQQGNAVTFYDESGQVADLLVVLSQTLHGPVDLLVDDFAVRLKGATLKRLG